MVIWAFLLVVAVFLHGNVGIALLLLLHIPCTLEAAVLGVCARGFGWLVGFRGCRRLACLCLDGGDWCSGNWGAEDALLEIGDFNCGAG